jgi:hypothetical protein
VKSLDAARAEVPRDTARDFAGDTGAPRVALALGMVGALGDELLAALVASPHYRLVYVALKQQIASASAKYRPWVIGSPPVRADDAYLCVSDAQTLLPRVSPVLAFDAGHLLDAARIARDAGARRLVVVAPLSALLQMNAASHTVSSEDELALVGMQFESLVIVRPSQQEIDEGGGAWLGRTVRSLGKMVLDIMLPAHVQALRPRTAALAILAAVDRTGTGVHVIGARELLTIVEETMPAMAPKRTRLR